ncbi:Uncharacterised protein [Mycobacteroides abscessus subsp. abscessus]|nr:Uncharacterised protein [Mycobacteroides abscessus subsp. abscessus]
MAFFRIGPEILLVGNSQVKFEVWKAQDNIIAKTFRISAWRFTDDFSQIVVLKYNCKLSSRAECSAI